MQLVNTIEISPYDYSKKEYECPNGTSEENPEEWNEYWLKCISDSNLGNLKSIQKGIYLVDIETINNIELEIILKVKLKEVELIDFENQVGILNGGIVVKIDNKIVITPKCCGDIENLNEWEKIFESEANLWNQLWIGHPWVFYKRVNGLIEISNYTESNIDEFEDIKVEYKLSEKELISALKKIRTQQNNFENRISTVLDNMKINNAKEIAKLMIGN